MRNPYIVGPPVRQSDFYGRSILIEEILEKRHQCTYLIGNRRVGKSSILWRLASRTKDIPLYLNLQRAPEGDPHKMGRLLAKEFNRVARRETKLANIKLRSGHDICETMEEFCEIAEMVDIHFLLLWDEADNLTFLDDNHLERLRSLLQDENNLSTVITATRALSTLQQRPFHTSPFLFGFYTQYIPSLTDQEARELICQTINDQDSILADDELIVEIQKLTGNHPFLIQRLCSKLFQRESRLRSIENRDKAVDEGLADVFQVDYDRLSRTERKIIRLISQKESLHARDLQKYLDLQPGVLDRHLIGLEGLGYLSYSDGIYEVANSFLNTWLKGDSVKETIEEINDQISLSFEESTPQPDIGIITALAKEKAAVEVMLENKRKYNKRIRGGYQRYLLGELPAENGHRHYVVLSSTLDMGTNSASVSTIRMLDHFLSIQDVIMVSIAGGVPHPEKGAEHVRLGDVVVSDRNGVVQYDYIKQEIKEDKDRYPPRPPSPRLLRGVQILNSSQLVSIDDHPLMDHINLASDLRNAKRPPEKSDSLRDFAFPDAPEPIPHPLDPLRIPGHPRIFVGPIASANTLLKDPQKRNILRDKFGVKAVEMEASGMAEAAWVANAGYLVVCGICDYCDPDKTDDWQEYAAVVAAAYTRALLESMPANTVEE